jgi:hypothetical protein
MISLTSLKPPASRFTRLGLLVTSTSALSFLRDGLGGADASAPSVVTLVPGISSQSTPAISKDFKKKGHNSVRIERDCVASAEDIGTGDDFMTAFATSDAGRARRLRTLGEEPDAAGVEKSLR